VEGTRKNLQQLVDKTRTHCAIEVLESTGAPITEVIPAESRAADLVYMGLKKPDQDYSAYYRKLQQMLEKMPTTVLCLAADEVAFDFILMPDA
jgi:DNA-binding NarL/FixJ family response regulator